MDAMRCIFASDQMARLRRWTEEKPLRSDPLGSIGDLTLSLIRSMTRTSCVLCQWMFRTRLVSTGHGPEFHTMVFVVFTFVQLITT